MNTSPDVNPSTTTILIAEDSPTQAARLAYLLENAGYSVNHARNGREALALAQQAKPTLIVSDVVMPEMTGYDLCRRIKDDATLQDIPFILVTTLSEPQDVMRGLESGADNFILKPYDDQQLLNRIQYALLNRNARDGARVNMGVEIAFGGEKYFVNADRMQILNMLLSTYEAALEKNRALAQAQQEANDMATRHQSVVDLAVDGIVTIDGQGTVQTFNKAAEKFFGYSASEVIGRNVKMLMPEPYRHEHDGYLKRYRETREARIIGSGREVYGKRKDGSTFPLELGISEMQLHDESYYIATLRDITERRRQLSELAAARETADAANRAKSEFLATMSHEIRTPMNGVIGMLDVLHRTSLRGYQVEMVDLIRESAAALLGIINDILDFSKIEAGKLDLEDHPFDLVDTVDGVCQILDRFAEKQGVELTVFTDPVLPDQVRGDGSRLRQVLTNLISNAIKFSSKIERPGHVSVRAVVSAQEVDRIHMDLHVIDNGIGMDKATLARLFQPFTQADSSTTRHYGGTGLGLTISRQLVELMGGEITVQSAPDQGSTFTVRVSFDVVKTEGAAEPWPDVAALSCLVIGGEQSLAPDLATYLTHAGAMVERAHDRDEARQWSKTATSGSWVWVIDVGDTHPTADELRDFLTLRPDLDVQLLAVVIERGKRRMPRQKDAGIVTIDGNALPRKMFLRSVAIAAGREKFAPEAQAVDAQRVAAAPSALTREEALARGRLILVAEDNETNQKVILQQLALLGYAGDIAEDGEEALERWRSGDYALILSDLHMPKVDGYELTAAIRAEESESSRIPIIALTANAMSGEAEQCLASGMNGYLSKPARLDQLEAELAQWIPSDEQPAAEKLSAESAAPDPTGRPQVAEAKSAQLVDIAVLENLVGDDPAMIREFLSDFRVSAAAIANELQESWRANEVSAVGSAAHKLKSSARSVGALSLGDACADVEAAAKAAQTDALTELVPRFTTTLEAVLEYLDAHLSNPK